MRESDQEIIIDDDNSHQSDINEEESTAITMLDALLMPTSIQYMDFVSLSYYITINKLTLKMVNEKSFWIAVNNSFASAYGLYTFCYDDLLHINAKKHFLNELVAAKNKFLSTSTIDTTTNKSFNIKVCARFRAGLRNTDNVNLPLHQFLKVRRKNIKEPEENNKCLVGEQDPEDFLDPLLGTLMKDPVLLKTSMRIVDRSCAVKSILRGGRDPFNNRKLSLADLIPQLELAEKIKVWKEKKKNIDISITMKDVKMLGDSMASDPELLAILMEADRLSSLSKRAQLDARETAVKSSEGHENNIDNDSDDIIIEDEVENIISNHGTENTSENNENANNNILGSNDNKGVNDNDDLQGPWKKNVESAKVVDINEQKSYVSVHVGGGGVKNFSFSCVNDGTTTQQKMYQKGAQESVMSALNGFNACLLCYGQTGSGKTFTLFGPESGLDIDPQLFDYKGFDNTGIVIRATAELLDAKERLKSNDVNLSLSAQFVEIYNEEVVDLLTGRAISIRRDNGELVGAVEAVFDNLSEAMEIIRLGQARKRFAATAMNERSSRSHTAFIIQLTQIKKENDVEKVVRSNLHLVDLAGSERIKKSKASGKNKVEAVNINSSLLVLGKVIAGLVESKSHIPFLESKLTTMLKSAFGGNCRTTTIINCRLDDSNGDETLQSLRFGERCSMISNTAKQAASSLESTIAALNDALSRVEQQIVSLDNRGKQHLDSYQKVKNSFLQMQKKRDELLKQAAITI